jgi:xanthine/CO dehydrogenase XdhC/CoxF family maturation factor
VVRIVGSAYRRPGAKLLIPEAGDGLGGVSGGCLEGDVREVALEVLASGRPRLLRYDTGADDVWALGLGCNGQVEIFVQPASAGPLAAVAEPWRRRLAGEEPFAVATVVAGDDAELGAALLVAEGATTGTLSPEAFADEVALRAGARLAEGRCGIDEVAGRLVFFEVLEPPRHLLVCGAGDDAMPLVAYAAAAGFRVTLIDHRRGLLEPSRFPAAARTLLARPEDAELALPPAGRSLAVVKTHSLAHDREWARRLLAAGVPYVGLLGPRARGEEIRRALGAAEDPRIFGPVGLDLGADGPRQVAIAIVAELLAVVAGRTPRHLCERREAIHVG